MSLDDVPIAGKGAYSLTDEPLPEEEEKAVSGPLDQRLDSKVWKVRINAYEELSALFSIGSDEACSQYLPHLGKCVADAHPGAQEQALNAVAQLLATKPHLAQGEVADNVARALVEKGFTSTKGPVKSLSGNILLTIFETLESGWAEFGGELTSCLENKNVKVQSAGVNAFTTLLCNFGPGDLPLKQWLPAVEKLATSPSPAVRSESVRFLKECYRWLGDAVMSSVQRMKKEQMDEILQGKEEGIPMALRSTKNTQTQGDPFDFAEPKDIFSRFNEAWCEQVMAMEKWTERKEALETLNIEADVPKLAERPADALVNMAKRFLGDANVQVVLQTIKLVGLLAKGQRKFFEPNGKQFVPLLFSKFKEKKAQILSETHQSLRHLLKSVKLSYFIEKLPKFLDDKTPSVRINLFLFLEHCISDVPEEMHQLGQPTSELLKKYANDSLAEVRDAAINTLGLLLAKTDTTNVWTALHDLLPAKLKKVQEIAQENGCTELPVSQIPTVVRRADRSSTMPATRRNEKPPLAVKAPMSSEEPQAEEAKTPPEVSPVRKPIRATLIPKKGKIDLNASQDSLAGNAGVKKAKRLETPLKLSVDELREDFPEKLKEQCRNLFPVEVLTNMFHKDFKKVLEAATALQQLLAVESALDLSDLVVKWVYIRLFDTNTQVLKAVLEVVSALLQTLGNAQVQLHDVEAGVLIPMLCERTGHNNAAVKTLARQVLHACIPVLSMSKFLSLLGQCIGSKNTKVKAESMDEMTLAIKESGSAAPQGKDIKSAAKLVLHSDAAVRTAAMNLIAEVNTHFPDALWQALAEFNDIKAKEAIEQRFRQPGQRSKTVKSRTPDIARSVSPMKSDSPFKPLPTDRALEIPLTRTPEPPLLDSVHVSQIPEPEYQVPSNETLLYEDTGKLEFDGSPLDENIKILRSGDMSSRVDALVAVNDLILNNLEKNRVEVQQKASILVDAMCTVMISTFDRQASEIPLRFAKYYLNVLQKVCSTKIIMRELSENTTATLVEQILTKLLRDDLGKEGEKGEGEQLLKVLNSTMVKILEHSDPTLILSVLFRLLSQWKREISKQKLAALAIKCLVKLEKVLNVLSRSIDLRVFLLKVHEFLISINEGEDSSAVRTVRSVVIGVAKAIGPSIWDAYESVRRHPQKDETIQRWLLGARESILESDHPENCKSDPLAEVFAKLKGAETYDDGLRELLIYRTAHPSDDLSAHLKTCSHILFDRITDDLRIASSQENELESSFKISEFQSRLANMKKRYGLASSNVSEHLTTTLSDLKSKVNLLLSAARPESAALASDARTRLENMRK